MIVKIRVANFVAWIDDITGQYHREDGPAVEYDNGDQYWFKQGLYHRLDGPAIDLFNSKRWFVDGEEIICSSQEEFEKLMKLKAFW